MKFNNAYFITGNAYAGMEELELINSQENYDRLLNSGFNVILREEKLGIEGTLKVVEEKFGLKFNKFSCII